MKTTRVLTTDQEPICEEYYTTTLAKCLAKASLDYSTESAYYVVVMVDDQEIPITVEVKPGWGD